MYLFTTLAEKKKRCQLNFLSEMKYNWLQSNSITPPHHQAKFPVVEAAGPLCSRWETDWSEGRGSHSPPPSPPISPQPWKRNWSTVEEMVAGWGTIQLGNSLWLIHLIIRHRALPVESGWLHKGHFQERMLSIFAHLRQFDSNYTLWNHYTTDSFPTLTSQDSTHATITQKQTSDLIKKRIWEHFYLRILRRINV